MKSVKKDINYYNQIIKKIPFLIILGLEIVSAAMSFLHGSLPTCKLIFLKQNLKIIETMFVYTPDNEKKRRTDMNAIKLNDLSKSYGKKFAVNHLNMVVPEGSIYGFIGQNGAGKSTTQKMICGLTPQTTGDMELFGKPQTDAEIKRVLKTVRW